MADVKGQGGASNGQIELLRKLRWRGRTDLFFLASRVLGYNDKNFTFGMTPAVHQPLFDILQHFPTTWEQAQKYDLITPTRIVYPYGGHPPISRKLLPSTRKRLILDPRSFFKTTINCICHSIQWLLNYPDIGLLIIQSNVEKAKSILKAIKEHFQFNTTFREIYPDYCPQGKRMKDWGNQEQFTLPNRQRVARPEPSCEVASIDKAMSGKHYEVMKFSDIVDPTNVKTDGSIDEVKYMFTMFQKLLVDPDDFIDVEGTRYHREDLYGSIIDSEKKLPPERRSWLIHVRGVYKRDTGGRPHTFLPEEMDLPYLTDEKGNNISWWPERFSYDKCESDRRATPEAEEVFATQMLNDPYAVEGRQVFNISRIPWKEPDEFQRIPIVYRTITVDTAETQSERSDFTSVCVAAWDRSGRCYIEDIRHGRFDQDTVINEILKSWVKYRPISLKIEETGFVRGIKPSLSRRAAQLGINPVIEFIPRDTALSKKERIKGIQPWYNDGGLWFVNQYPDATRTALIRELADFPQSRFDDILDSVADQFANKDYYGRITARKTMEETFAYARDIKLGLIEGEPEPPEIDPLLAITGGL